jgi:transcriptional regulator with XRE-family HTH domain
MNERLTAGQRIRERREEMEMSQIELGRRVGIKRSSMSNIESGKTKCPAGTTLMKIAGTLDLSPEWILNGTGPKDLSSVNISDEPLTENFNKLNKSNQQTLIALVQAMLASQADH